MENPTDLTLNKYIVLANHKTIFMNITYDHWDLWDKIVKMQKTNMTPEIGIKSFQTMCSSYLMWDTP